MKIINIHFSGRFSDALQFPSVVSCSCSRKEPLGISGTGLNDVPVSQCVKTLNPNQWSSLILSSSTTGALIHSVPVPVQFGSKHSYCLILTLETVSIAEPLPN